MYTEKKLAIGRGQMFFCIMSILALVLTFVCSESVIGAMSSAMALCVSTVIPSLFPFMVLSALLVHSGVPQLLGNTPGRVFGAVFGISCRGGTAALLGFVCGFPIGIQAATALYRRGLIDKNELGHLCMFCNNPSSGFLISAVGGRLFGSVRFGIILYAANLISGIIVGIAGRFFYPRSSDGEQTVAQSEAEPPAGIVMSICDAVRSSAVSMLYICAFVLFFSALLGALQSICSALSVPPVLTPLLYGFFEMTGGISAAAVLPTSTAVLFAAAISGWSGLSVHFQLCCVCDGCRFSLKPYFCAKVATAFLNCALVTLLLKIFGSELLLSPPAASSFLMLPFSAHTAFSLAAFAASLLLLRRNA